MSEFFQKLLTVFLSSAPWLLLGFFIAGLVKVFISPDFLHKHLGKNNFSSVIKGAILGAPLPLCSCGVIPAALGIRRSGASKAATTSFLIATPETGVDSVLLTYALLGPLMAFFRPLAAIVTAIASGLAVLFFDVPSNACQAKAIEAQVPQSCCHKKEKVLGNDTNIKKKESTSCCSKKRENEKFGGSKIRKYWLKISHGLSFTFVDLVRDTSLWLMIGLFMSAIMMTCIPASFLREWGGSPYAYLLMAIVGVPMYICATASTPIAAGLLFAGVSPGAVLVFLLVGPATNIATLAIVRSELGGRVVALYLGTVVLMSFLFAGLLDGLSHFLGVGIISQTHFHEHTGIVHTICGVILTGILLNGLRLRYLSAQKSSQKELAVDVKN